MIGSLTPSVEAEINTGICMCSGFALSLRHKSKCPHFAPILLQDNGGQDEFTQEVETAWAVGFNGMSITEEEEDLLPLGANEARYVHVRFQSVNRAFGFSLDCDAVASLQPFGLI